MRGKAATSARNFSRNGSRGSRAGARCGIICQPSNRSLGRFDLKPRNQAGSISRFQTEKSRRAAGVVSFLTMARGIPESEAARELIRWAGVRVAMPFPRLCSTWCGPPIRRSQVCPCWMRARRRSTRGLQGCGIFLPPFPSAFDGWISNRTVPSSAIALAVGRKLLRFTDSREGRAWVVTDRDRWAAQARRLDGKPWQRLTGQPKAWTLAGSRASWPIGFADAARRERVALVEGVAGKVKRLKRL